MKSKNLFFFVFIFFINTKIHASSEDYGYISISFESGSDDHIDKDYLKGYEDILFNCSALECNISFKNDNPKLSELFYTSFKDYNKISIIDFSNLKIISKDISEMFFLLSGLKEIRGMSKLNTS